jgi:hypothetical protein
MRSIGGKSLLWAIGAAFALSLAGAGSAQADEARVYVKAVSDTATWDHYSRTIKSDEFGKFIIDIKSKDIYFIDVNLFKLHYDFVRTVLLDNEEYNAENVRRYNKNYDAVKPRFILGYITHHLKIDKWTFAFWEGDEIVPKDVKFVHNKLGETFFKKGLLFRPDSPAQLKVAKKVARMGVKTITNDEVYKLADYQSFNNGKAVGTLRVVVPGTPYESLLFDRNDIVLLQEAYPDISPVAGIVSTVFSTPLAHVNLRATAWGIPNAGYVKAYDEYKGLDGKVVYLDVTDTTHVLREATAQEIDDLKNKINEQRTVRLPPAVVDDPHLAMLTAIRATDVDTYGAKTANLGAIASARLAGVNVPMGFGVPFFYYKRHMEQNGLYAAVDAVIGDEKFKTDAAWRKGQLEKLRQTILDAPMDEDVMNAIYKRVRIKLGGKGVFVRSSTNAEDLEGFNGAGLYDTVPNVRGKKNIEQAIKTVWASLWNFRAVEERSLFGIDHHQVYAGVLVQIGVNPTAAGVLITTNLYNPEDGDSYTINAKWGVGIRVVEGKKIPEQIIFDTSNDGTKIISRSDDKTMLVFDDNGGVREVPVEHDGVILTEERAKALADVVERFVPLFPKEYALDVEWLFEDDLVWIVQSRPYVAGGKR